MRYLYWITSGLMAGLLAACASNELPEDPPELPLEGSITISSGGCTALCPEYRMRIYPDDRYELTARDNTINPGRHEGALPVNSYRRADEALRQYGFQDMDRFYTPSEPENCPELISGLPTVDISRLGDERHIVTYDTGCLGFAERDTLDRLNERLRSIFRVRNLIAVGEPPDAEEEKRRRGG